MRKVSYGKEKRITEDSQFKKLRESNILKRWYIPIRTLNPTIYYTNSTITFSTHRNKTVSLT